MKIAFLIISVVLLMVVCVTKRPEYNYPPNRTEETKKEFEYSFYQGKTLYHECCAQCHDRNIKKKLVTPDFTLEALELYKIRSANTDHLQRLTTSLVSQSDLALITVYLVHKQRSGVPFKNPNK